MQPHIAPVRGRHQVAPPLMTYLVKEQAVKAEGVVLKIITIGRDGLVLHTEIGRLGHAYLIRAKGVWAKPLFYEMKVLHELGKERLGFLVILRDGVEDCGHALARDALKLAI